MLRFKVSVQLISQPDLVLSHGFWFYGVRCNWWR